VAVADLDRAARIVALLSRFDRGIEIAQLLEPRESLDALDAPLAYLLFYDWIGTSKKADRVWLQSEARKRLPSPAGA
jgi:hypothetical protein